MNSTATKVPLGWVRGGSRKLTLWLFNAPSLRFPAHQWTHSQ